MSRVGYGMIIFEINDTMTPLFKPYIPLELPKLDAILHSGQLAYGKYAREFEKGLADYIGISRVLCTNSFNSAYLLLIKALDLKPGDEVISSPMCCLASSQPFAIFGVKLIWADIDPAVGTLDPEAVKKALTPATKAIVHNHFCGYVGYVDEIRSLAKEKGLLLIDDASEAFGSEYNGLKAGNWDADATVYSFQTVRLPNSIDGGAVSFKSEKHYERALLLRDYGINRSKFRDELGEINPLCDIDLASFGCLPSDVNSYIGIQCLKETPELLTKQRENAFNLTNNLPQGISAMNPLAPTKPNYWVFGALAKNKREFIRKIQVEDQHGISGVHLPNTYYTLFGTQPELSGVNEFHQHFVALPCGWWL